MTTTSAPVTPVHQWTHTGTEVLILKCVPADGHVVGTGDNGKPYRFTWPLTVGALVDAPDWDPAPRCGGGLHGWPWGLSFGNGRDPDWVSPWLVLAAQPQDVVNIDGKVKARRGRIAFVGDWQSATNYVLSGQIAWVLHRTLNAPDHDNADSGAASATGKASLASVTGLNGCVRGGAFSAIALAWWNESQQRVEMRCARVGVGDGSDGLLKANQWYELTALGEFVEISI